MREVVFTADLGSRRAHCRFIRSDVCSTGLCGWCPLDTFLQDYVVFSGSVYEPSGRTWYGSREQLREAILRTAAEFVDAGAGI